MSDAPIPFIAYFFITVTAGTLAYATYTDTGDNLGTVTEDSPEGSKEDNQELSNTNESEKEPQIQIENQDNKSETGNTEQTAPNEQQGIMPNITQTTVPVAQPIEEKKITMPPNEQQQSLSNPFQKEETKEPVKEQKGFFDGFNLGTKKGGKSRKNKKNKKTNSKKNKNNIISGFSDKNIKEMRRLLQQYKKSLK